MMNMIATFVFVLFLVGVTIFGFIAPHWRKGDLAQLDEWGLGGRRFGTVVTWFLLGGDLYTAYTFVAVPVLVFGAGATGFFALPYTILIYPFVFVVFPKLWSTAKRHGYVTAADFVHARYNSRMLALAIAHGHCCDDAVYRAAVGGYRSGDRCARFFDARIGGRFAADHRVRDSRRVHVTSGLRAPAMIAVVKDILIYIPSLRR